jgi:hypothetical protein
MKHIHSGVPLGVIIRTRVRGSLVLPLAHNRSASPFGISWIIIVRVNECSTPLYYSVVVNYR